MKLIKNGKMSDYIPGGIIYAGCNCSICVTAKKGKEYTYLKPLEKLKTILPTNTAK